METQTLPTHDGVPDEKQSMEAIRDLLFGQKTREIGDQIGEVESRLKNSISELENRLNNRFESLESFVKAEIGSAKEQFDSERSEHEKFQSEAGEKVKTLGDSLNDRFGKVKEDLKKLESENRNQVFERTKALSDEIADLSRRIHEKIDGEMGNLRKTAARKNELSELLIELGMRMQPKDEDGGDHDRHHD
ncbi:MAG: hypothetical protein HKN23_01110 [Verrucomicrobiales bacterium]|nr:hypothetical protein [Verrucomicrobiales bacterium]